MDLPPRAILPLGLVFLAACGAPPVKDASRAAVDPPDPLHVEGNRFVAGTAPVRLLGVNHSGGEYACVKGHGFFEGPSAERLAAAVLRWKANVVRLPLNEHCWLGINGVAAHLSGTAYRRAVVERVATLRRHGLYVILDLHWSAPGAYPATGQQPMPDSDHAIDFWTSVAATFEGDRGVLFDLHNEPFANTENAITDDPWDCWRRGCVIKPSAAIPVEWRAAGMQALLDAIRATGAPNVVLVGGLKYANDLSGWLAHAPLDPLGQLAASVHLYNFNGCHDETCWATQIEPVRERVPVVTGELGEDDCAHGFVDAYGAWADARGISYLGWTWNPWACGEGPALIADDDGTPTPFGAGLKARFERNAAPRGPLGPNP